jgi:hypothetical protein
MSNLENTGRASRRGALAEAAERLDKIARVVKDQQLSETRTGPRVALTESMVASPEEAWAKKFMTQAIGPVAIGSQPAAFPALAPQNPVPLASQDYVAVLPSLVASHSARGAAIGAAIARRSSTRTWLGWLFLGR